MGRACLRQRVRDSRINTALQRRRMIERAGLDCGSVLKQSFVSAWNFMIGLRKSLFLQPISFALITLTLNAPKFHGSYEF